MSRDDSSQQHGSDPLQFDVAEDASSDGGVSAHDAGACTQCGSAIASSYYQLNGSIICPRCRGGLDTADGSRARRILAATGLGMLAALGGSLVYFAIAALTGYEFGLVAIAVGYVVGKAVHKGSRGRGGWAYQTLAIGLTYFAIVSTYIPLAMREFRANPAQADSLRIALNSARDSAAKLDSLDEADDEMDDSTVVADSALAVTQAGSPANKSARAGKPVKLGAGMVLIGLLALLVFAAIAPILAGFSNIIGLVIIFFAVFQAWSLNKRVPLEITGPYRVGRDGVGASS